MAITVPDHVLSMSRSEVAEFSIAFARFEFALKASRFGKNGRGGEAKADWDEFARTIAALSIPQVAKNSERLLSI